MSGILSQLYSSLTTPVERRLFVEYGAVFITAATPPPVVIFQTSGDVERFQRTLETSSASIGEFTITLQRSAMEALRAAGEDLADGGLQLSARAEDSGGRSYDDTVRLWTRNVTRGLEHWQESGMLDASRAAELAALKPVDQVARILEIEERDGLYFGTYFDRSILYSVAAPGASQHLSLLAFDVAEYESQRVKEVLNQHGWFRTVPNDLPHFTFLGHRLEDLAELGLKQIEREYGDRSYSFFVPDVQAPSAQ